MIGRLLDGALETASGATFPDACRAIQRIWLAGGRPDLAACAAVAPRPAQVSAHGVFAGVRGGVLLLDGADGLVVDLGQTGAKVGRPGRAPGRVERDGKTWDALLREALGATVPDGAFGRGFRLVLGLPAELSEAGAGACSYFGALAFEELARQLPRDLPAWVTTDAELAGLAARAETSSSADLVDGPLLALTLGHGVGAAMVSPA